MINAVENLFLGVTVNLKQRFDNIILKVFLRAKALIQVYV